MAPIVFAFEGTRRFGHPGWVETAERVQQDFGEWRRTTSTDGKSIAKWLIAHGYRVLNYAGRANDGSTYHSWWGLVSVFGEPNNEHGLVYIPVEEIREKVKQHQEQPTPASKAQDAALKGLDTIRQYSDAPLKTIAESMYDYSSKPAQMQQQLAAMRKAALVNIAREHPELSARDVAEEYKARMSGGSLYA